MCGGGSFCFFLVKTTMSWTVLCLVTHDVNSWFRTKLRHSAVLSFWSDLISSTHQAHILHLVLPLNRLFQHVKRQLLQFPFHNMDVFSASPHQYSLILSNFKVFWICILSSSHWFFLRWNVESCNGGFWPPKSTPECQELSIEPLFVTWKLRYNYPLGGIHKAREPIFRDFWHPLPLCVKWRHCHYISLFTSYTFEQPPSLPQKLVRVFYGRFP